jgi:hypothetical protein
MGLHPGIGTRSPFSFQASDGEAMPATAEAFQQRADMARDGLRNVMAKL